MAKTQLAYGLAQPLESVFPAPVIGLRAPLATDVNYPDGQIWIDQPNLISYIKLQTAAGSATWEDIGGGTAEVDQLTGDSGTAIPAGGSILIAGGTNITTAAAGATVTVNLDAAIALTSVQANSFTTDNAARGLTISDNDISADGTDASIDINLLPKNAGTVKASSGLGFEATTGDFIASRSAVAGAGFFQGTNTENATGTSFASMVLTTGGAAGGDPHIQLAITGAQILMMGLDNSDSDYFKLADTSFAGTIAFQADLATGTCRFPSNDVHIDNGSLIASASAAATNISLQATNSDNTAATSHASVQITTGGAASGNPYVDWYVNGVSTYSMGLFNLTANDPLTITNATGLTGTILQQMDGTTLITTFGTHVDLATIGMKFGMRTDNTANTAACGSAILVGGTVTVLTSAVATGPTTNFSLTRRTAGGVLGHLSIANLVANTSFDIISDNAGDTSTVDWLLIRNLA